jgi:hypothetical protein
VHSPRAGLRLENLAVRPFRRDVTVFVLQHINEYPAS